MESHKSVSHSIKAAWESVCGVRERNSAVAVRDPWRGSTLVKLQQPHLSRAQPDQKILSAFSSRVKFYKCKLIELFSCRVMENVHPRERKRFLNGFIYIRLREMLCARRAASFLSSVRAMCILYLTSHVLLTSRGQQRGPERREAPHNTNGWKW